MAKIIAYVTRVDKELFKSIYIDKVFIYIGKRKEKLTTAGLYNQICDYFLTRKKLPKFIAWLCNEYGMEPTEHIPESIIGDWENKLVLATRSTIYTEVLRLEKSGDGSYSFYAIKNQGSQLRYLCNMELNPNYMNALKQFLKYNEVCNDICDRLEIEHPMDKSDSEIRKDIDRCIRYKLIPRIDQVKILSNDINSYCLGYFDIECGNPKKPTPAWDSFMTSVPADGSKECFMAFIYSIFKGDNFGKQMLWIQGRGDSGKSKVLQALKKRMELINPGIVTALAPAFFHDKFTSISHVKKRLTIAQDCADRSIVKNQLVKNITGNDDTSVRGMGMEERHANIYSKLVVTSNFQPWVNPNKSEELSRILYINLDPETSLAAKTAWSIEKDGDWGELIFKEIDNFIAKCKPHYYANLTEDGHNIKIYDNMIDNLTNGSFLSDNMKPWWETCVRPFVTTKMKKTNVIYYDDLCKDYKRFLGNRGRNPRYVRGINTTLIPFLLEHDVVIHTLTDTNNSKYIVGFEYISEDEDDRFTLDMLLDKRAEEIGIEGNPVGEIFAKRNKKDKIGWNQYGKKNK